jgi:hypothetical protein
VPQNQKSTDKQMWVGILLKAILFMIMVPGVHLNIPPGASLPERAVIHGVIFAVLNYYVYLYVRPMLEGFDNPDTKVEQACPPGYKKCGSGDCVLESDMHGPCPESSFGSE